MIALLLRLFISIGMFLFFTFPVFSKSDNNTIDSLFSVLKYQTTQDTIKWNTLHAISRAYDVLSPDSAILFGNLALQLATTLQNQELIFKSLNDIGVGYIRKEKQEDAINYFLKAAKLATNNEGKLWRKYEAQALINVTGVLLLQKQLEKALLYAHQSKNILEQLNEPSILADNYQVIGLIYNEIPQIDSSILYYEKAKAFYEYMGNTARLGRTLGMIGDLYVKKQQFAKALPLFEQSLKIAENVNDLGTILVQKMNIASIYTALGNYNAATKLYQEARVLAEMEGLKTSRSAFYVNFSDFFAKNNRFDSAYHYLELAWQVREDLFNEERTQKINELEIAYQTQLKEQENEILRQKNKFIQTSNFYLYIISALLFVSAIIEGIYLHQLIKKNQIITKQKETLHDLTFDLAQSNKDLSTLLDEKSHLTNLITHDIQTPLSVIQFTTAALQHQKSNTPALKADLNAIEQAAQQISHLSTRIMDLQRASQSLNYTLKIESLNLQKIIDETNMPYLQWSRKKNIKVIQNIKAKGLKVLADAFLLSKAYGNVLGNAIKFSEPGKSILIDITTSDRFACIAIKDEGPGIDQEEKLKLFQAHKKLKARPTLGEPSSGNGLYLTKRYLEAMRGTIDVISGYGKGSTFVIQIPLAE